MNSINTLLTKLTLTTLCGVAIGFYFSFSISSSSILLATCFSLLLLIFVKQKKSLIKNPLFGTLAFVTFFTLGIFTTSFHLPSNQSSHFSNYISSEASDEQQMLQLTISEVLKPDLYNEKFIAKVNFLNQRPVHGKLLLLQPKDILQKELRPGVQLILASEIKKINKPLNPYQFDYNRFMSLRGVEGQVRLKPHYSEILDHEEQGIKSWAYQVRERIKDALKKYRFQPEELAIIQALLLGQKQQISEEIYQNYADAGAIHILAVSGLHVGIVMLIISWLLTPLKRLKNGRFLRSFLIILCLWLFAVISGLSPSVVRAVTMFSFVSIGLELGRRTSTIHSVFLSLLLLVFIRPQWIFDVGFQLSYSAVLAILLIQPLLLKLWTPQNRLTRYFWVLLATTFAAQLGVLPLSLFYFHQFPGLFFLSNLVILPFLGLILGFGILVMVLASFSILPFFLAKAYQLLIFNLNSFVHWVAQQEEFLFRDIAFSFSQMLAVYLLIILLLIYFHRPSYRSLILSLTAVIILQVVLVTEASKELEEIVIFHRSGRSLIGSQKAGNLHLFALSDINSADQKVITNYKIGSNIRQQQNFPLRNIFEINGKMLLLIDSTGIYPKNFNPDFLLLSNSPKINLEKAVDELKPSTIIADGSNYKFLLELWQKTSREKNITLHATAENGAFIIK